jgi:hypothetical protein
MATLISIGMANQWSPASNGQSRSAAASKWRFIFIGESPFRIHDRPLTGSTQ